MPTELLGVNRERRFGSDSSRLACPLIIPLGSATPCCGTLNCSYHACILPGSSPINTGLFSRRLSIRHLICTTHSCSSRRIPIPLAGCKIRWIGIFFQGSQRHSRARSYEVERCCVGSGQCTKPIADRLQARLCRWRFGRLWSLIDSNVRRYRRRRRWVREITWTRALWLLVVVAWTQWRSFMFVTQAANHPHKGMARVPL